MRSILLVDDDAEIRLALRDFLTTERFVVHTARDGQHALHVLEKIDPREWSGAHLEVEEVLSKPVDLEVLRTTVNRIFAEHL